MSDSIKGFTQRYFLDHYDYPDPTEIFLASDCNELFLWKNGSEVLLSYISNSFLDGWINYVKIVEARVIARYNDRGTPDALIAKYLATKPPHVKFGQFGDDVAVLARDKGGRWWYFYYDCDVSDCSVGRFKTNDDDATVLASFVDDCGDSAVIPKECLNGWHSW